MGAGAIFVSADSQLSKALLLFVRSNNEGAKWGWEEVHPQEQDDGTDDIWWHFVGDPFSDPGRSYPVSMTCQRPCLAKTCHDQSDLQSHVMFRPAMKITRPDGLCNNHEMISLGMTHDRTTGRTIGFMERLVVGRSTQGLVVFDMYWLRLSEAILNKNHKPREVATKLLYWSLIVILYELIWTTLTSGSIAYLQLKPVEATFANVSRRTQCAAVIWALTHGCTREAGMGSAILKCWTCLKDDCPLGIPWKFDGVYLWMKLLRPWSRIPGGSSDRWNCEKRACWLGCGFHTRQDCQLW